MMMIDAFMPEGVTRLAVDSIFMMPQLGVLSDVHEKAAIEVFEKDCLIHLGTCVAPVGEAREGKPLCSYVITFPDGKSEKGTLTGGEMKRLALGIDESTNLPLKARIALDPERGIDCGAGPGTRIEANLSGGVVGIVLDGRGRPFNLSDLDASDRVRKLKEWMTAMDIYPEASLNHDGG
jgi:hypothetical protein